MLSLVIPVYRNEGSIPDLLDAVEVVNSGTPDGLEAIFVVDGSPDRCYELLREALPECAFHSRLALLSRNFGSFAAVRAGLQIGTGERFAVMAADLQEPPELVLQMNNELLGKDVDVVLGVREDRSDPMMTRHPAGLYWALYRRLVITDIPAGGASMSSLVVAHSETRSCGSRSITALSSVRSSGSASAARTYPTSGWSVVTAGRHGRFAGSSSTWRTASSRSLISRYACWSASGVS